MIYREIDNSLDALNSSNFKELFPKNSRSIKKSLMPQLNQQFYFANESKRCNYFCRKNKNISLSSKLDKFNTNNNYSNSNSSFSYSKKNNFKSSLTNKLKELSNKLTLAGELMRLNFVVSNEYALENVRDDLEDYNFNQNSSEIIEDNKDEIVNLYNNCYKKKINKHNKNQMNLAINNIVAYLDILNNILNNILNFDYIKKEEYDTDAIIEDLDLIESEESDIFKHYCKRENRVKGNEFLALLSDTLSKIKL